MGTSRRLRPAHVLVILLSLALPLSLYLQHRNGLRREGKLRADCDDQIHAVLLELQECRTAEVERCQAELFLLTRNDSRYAEALARTTDRLLALELVRERVRKLEASRRSRGEPRAGPKGR